jgi:hypothetical protein
VVFATTDEFAIGRCGTVQPGKELSDLAWITIADSRLTSISLTRVIQAFFDIAGSGVDIIDRCRNVLAVQAASWGDPVCGKHPDLEKLFRGTLDPVRPGPTTSSVTLAGGRYAVAMTDHITMRRIRDCDDVLESSESWEDGENIPLIRACNPHRVRSDTMVFLVCQELAQGMDVHSSPRSEKNYAFAGVPISHICAQIHLIACSVDRDYFLYLPVLTMRDIEEERAYRDERDEAIQIIRAIVVSDEIVKNVKAWARCGVQAGDWSAMRSTEPCEFVVCCALPVPVHQHMSQVTEGPPLRIVQCVAHMCGAGGAKQTMNGRRAECDLRAQVDSAIAASVTAMIVLSRTGATLVQNPPQSVAGTGFMTPPYRLAACALS